VHANLTRFIELALEVDSGRYPSLTRYLNALAVLQQQPSDAPDAPPSMGHQQRVQILTIHAAKGLEAPVVFLADAAHGRKHRQSNEVFIHWPVDETRPQAFFLAPGRSWPAELTVRHQQREQQEQQREETDLLYVALTRAEQLLFISGTRGSRQKGFCWYAEIAAGYGYEAEDIDEPVILEQANERPVIQSTQTAPQPTPPALDRRLQQPLTVKALHQEIAPSRDSLWEPGEGGMDDEDARQRGIVIHQMLQALCEQPDIQLATLRNRVGAIGIDEALLQKWWQEAQAVVNESSLRELFDPALFERAYNEVPVYFQHEGSTVHGIIDRLVISDNRIVVIDYKTHGHAHPDNLATLAAPYVPQMRWYVEGVQRLWPGHTLETFLLFTACRQMYPLPPA
jgi:ATP-dependent helicase/nuclease subunit A